jgi:hypothetical protein
LAAGFATATATANCKYSIIGCATAMANVASEDAKAPATFVLCASFQRRQRRY